MPHIEKESQQNWQIWQSLLSSSLFLDSLGAEVRTTSESDFLDFKGVLTFNALHIFPSTF